MSTLTVTRACSVCGVTEDKAKFQPRYSTCRPCYKEKQAKRNKEYYAKNREKLIAQAMKYERDNYEVVKQRKDAWRKRTKEERIAYVREYEKKNQVVMRAKRRMYYLKNKERILARHSEYIRSEHGKAIIANLSHKRRVADTVRFAVIPKDLKRLRNSPCVACGERNVHMDHVIPVSRGGSHGIGNLQPLCQSCNSKKGTRFMIEWRRDNKVLSALSEVA